ncbi:hypothetical protein Dsin_014027 [Dipteronia sinensis]|uniref:MATH domain-containing protein n=1 Tax=Dipteronia sinensis TaxID=43782 RepID=A0AAE0E9Z0_9ROSI|nr:hypothetical protein Dsin_014027 [Dipteronia sinensis]
MSSLFSIHDWHEYMAADSNLIGRTAPPSHYLIEIMSFSLLKASKIAFTSDEFDAGDYKWKLCIYPTENRKLCIYPTGNRKYVKDHISIYLELVQTSSLPAEWEVNVIFKFFIFNYFQNKYFSTKDWCECRYHEMNLSVGIAEFINLETFSNPKNGYLLDDTCALGVEVFVVTNTLKKQCLSMIHKRITYFHSWKVTNFSTLLKESYMSETFGCYKWNIVLYPVGCGGGKGNSISIFLDQSIIPSDTKLVVTFILRVKDQKNGNQVQFEDNHLFAPNDNIWGRDRFLSFADLEDPKQGFLVDDTLIIEAEVTLLGLVISES